MSENGRLKTGISALDDILGGGFLPGKRVLVYGATGVGKTILGVTLAHAGIKEDGHPGLILDVATQGDSQGQTEYAKNLFGWNLQNWETMRKDTPPASISDYAYRGASILKMTPSHPDITSDFWRHHLPSTKRIIVDGSELYEKASQNPLFEEFRIFVSALMAEHSVEIYKSGGHLFIDNPAYWNHFVTDEQIRAYCETEDSPYQFGFAPAQCPQEEKAQYQKLWNKEFGENNYTWLWDKNLVGPDGKYPANTRAERTNGTDKLYILLQTTKEKNIIELVNRDIEVESLDAEVNTIIVMGYFPVTDQNTTKRRGLAVVKHRGSKCDDSIIEYGITDDGIKFINPPS